MDDKEITEVTFTVTISVGESDIPEDYETAEPTERDIETAIWAGLAISGPYVTPEGFWLESVKATKI